MTQGHATVLGARAGAPEVDPRPPAQGRAATMAPGIPGQRKRIGLTVLAVFMVAVLGCGPKPEAHVEPGSPTGPPGWDQMEWGPWAIEGGDSTSVAVKAEEYLTAAEAALTTAAERQAAADIDGYRESLAGAFEFLRAAETIMCEDAASFAYMRPAYEGLIADLRSGMATAGVETASDLYASPDELARAGEVHLTNGATYEMPIDPDDPLVAKYLALFKEGKRREYLEDAFERSNNYRAMILEEIRKQGLPEELWVVPIVESGYKVNAYSRARAVGLWQFMTTTGRNYGLTINEWVDERRDPVKSTRAAMAYLKDLYLWFNNWDFALAAYNRGEGGIHRDIQKSRIADFMEMAELGATHTETQNHVPQIHAAAIIAKHPEKYGFKLVDNPIQADTVVIDYVVDLELVAECVGATERDLRELNPELRTWITPVLSVDYPTYTLKLPRGTADRFRTQIAQHEDKTPRRQLTYVVRKGDTLGGIAHKFGVGTTDLKRWNNLKSSRIRRGQKLVVIPDRDKVRTSRVVVADASTGAGTSSGVTAGSGSSQGSSDTLIHTVQRGDTLYDIALRYGTSVGELRRLNGLSSKGKIYPGQKLKVQDGNSD